MNNQDLQQLIDYFIPYIDKMITDKIKFCLKTSPAIVVSASNSTHTAIVKQIYSDTEMELNNNTGKNLQANDSVTLMWFTSMSNAWIGIKNDGIPWGW